VVARSIFLDIFRVFGGFLHQGRNIELGSLQEGATWIRVSTVWRGKTWHLDFRLQGGFLLALDLSFCGVWHHLEISFSWAEILVFSSIQQDVPAARGLDVTLVLIVFDLHYISNLWRLVLSYQEHFVAAHIFSLGAI
jgi:hypothetical protein